MDASFNNKNEAWEYSLDIDDSDLHLTPVVRLVQQARLLKEKVFILDPDGALMSTQQYMDKVVEDVGDDDDFKSAAWLTMSIHLVAL
ncbi:hypothetical protein Tco_1456233 [Tanacetum coccineum]